MTKHWALAVERWDDLEKALADGLLTPAAGGWQATLADHSPVRFERLYAGDEFCHHLIPARSDFARLLAAADELGVPVTLASPPVTDEGLAELRPLLTILAERPDAEVVANDWGTLRLTAREFPAVRRVLGRTLRRQLKDPRAEDKGAASGMTAGYVALLERYGVAMVSADRLPDGPTTLPLAMHVPYEFVTSGRICSVSGVPFPDAKKFLVDFACPKPCRDFYLDLNDPSVSSPVRQKGNTLYAPNGGLDNVAQGEWVARWVYDLSIDKTASLLAVPAEVGV